jgi:hypothetical protein
MDLKSIPDVSPLGSGEEKEGGKAKNTKTTERHRLIGRPRAPAERANQTLVRCIDRCLRTIHKSLCCSSAKSVVDQPSRLVQTA